MGHLNRVIFERIEDGIVTHGRTATHSRWPAAFCDAIERHRYDAVMAEMLLSELQFLLDRCDSATDISAHDKWIAAAWGMYAQLCGSLIAPDEVERVKAYEAAVRSGEEFKERDESL